MGVYVRRDKNREGEKKRERRYILCFAFRITCIMLVGISVIFSGTSLNGGNTLKEKIKSNNH